MFILENIERLQTACFTGHRSQKLPWRSDEEDERCKKMKASLEEQIVKAIDAGYRTFLCGMAIGFDMICAETVLALKESNPDIRLIGALPCKTQGDRWSAKNRRRYEYLLSRLDGVRCIYDDYTGIECMHERNRYMVDKSSLIIALFNGTAGGTKSTIDYAKKRGLEIVVIEP